jgi:hypothetical protein
MTNEHENEDSQQQLEEVRNMERKPKGSEMENFRGKMDRADTDPN